MPTIRMATIFAICALVSLHPAATLASSLEYRHSSHLADFALQKTLHDASPVFGNYRNVQSSTSTWMKPYPDNTLIAHMNIPGTHDTATWNYSQTTQDALDHITDLAQIVEISPAAYRCQRKPIVDMLNDGIRVFDLRYAYDVTNSTLVFWHGPALQSETATVEDVLFGYYQWLDDHPTEAVFLSFQYQGSTAPHAQNDASVQRLLFSALTSPASKKYILQIKDTIGTLGKARGKVTLLRRFDLDKLDPSFEKLIPGVHFSPADWTDNSPNITLIYNNATGETAFIEDLYQPPTPEVSSAQENIAAKFNATTAHLQMAVTSHPDSLFWSFASSTNLLNTPSDTPETQALGNGTLTPAGGVNQQLVPFFKTMHGKRLGIVMFDFYETPSDLIPAFLSLLPPKRS